MWKLNTEAELVALNVLNCRKQTDELKVEKLYCNSGSEMFLFFPHLQFSNLVEEYTTLVVKQCKRNN